MQGFFSTWVHFKNRFHEILGPPVLVLLYHRVTNLPYDPQQLAVSPVNFRNHLAYLTSNYNVCRFEDNWCTHKRPNVVITFDDGYEDNLLEALPILREYNVPATVFVATDAVENRECFWWDELAALVLEGEPKEHFTLEDKEYGGRWPTSSFDEKTQLYWRLHGWMLGLDLERRKKWLMQLKSWTGLFDVNPGNYRLMSPQQVKEIAADPLITIGAHGQSHTRLSLLSPAEQKREIQLSRDKLKDWTGKSVDVFSYPFGTKRDFSTQTIDICRETGFKRVAANIHGCSRRLTNSFRTPRCLIRNWGVNAFSDYVKGCWKK